MGEKEKISMEQTKLALEFLKHIFSEDVDSYWNLICKADQSRVYGKYVHYKEEGGSISFRDYVKDHIKPEHEKLFNGLRDNDPGISNVVRYSEQGEPMIYYLPNVKVERTYIGPNIELVYPLGMVIDTEHHKGDLKANWKIRLYKDQYYKELND